MCTVSNGWPLPSGLAGLVHPFLRRGVWNEEKIVKRQKIESRGLPVNTVTNKALSLLLIVLIYPNQKGKAPDSHDTQNKHA